MPCLPIFSALILSIIMSTTFCLLAGSESTLTCLAIGESNVGVYPQTSPGGWNKIGKTYVPFFDKKNNPPNVLVPGDKINFFSISIDELESKLIDFSDSMNKFKLNSFEIIY